SSVQNRFGFGCINTPFTLPLELILSKILDSNNRPTKEPLVLKISKTKFSKNFIISAANNFSFKRKKGILFCIPAYSGKVPAALSSCPPSVEKS
ncbi:MAG: hypothetical protein ACTSPV_17500, partial [Candidatus Hodarchaeales archaeon]